MCAGCAVRTLAECSSLTGGYAEDLEAGDLILSLDGDYGLVEAVVVVKDANQPMYNLTVDEAHTFFVGDGDWLVHNVACGIPPYAIGNLGELDVVRKHNLETLALYDPSKTTVFSSVYDIHSRRWVGFPSEGTVLKSGKIPPIGFEVLREGGHETVWNNWRKFDSLVTQTNLGESGLVGFTLYYTDPSSFGIRWTSRSINMKNWMVDIAPENYTSIFGGDPIPLRSPTLQSVKDATDFNIFYIPDTMSTPKQRP